MVAKTVISPDFTIEDIHKIREWNYEQTKDMTMEEGPVPWPMPLYRPCQCQEIP